MNILDELKSISGELGKFPTHGDLVRLKAFKLRNAIIKSKIKISEYAKQLGMESAKPSGYWTEDKLLQEYKRICEQYNGWPSKDVWKMKKNNFFYQMIFRNGLTPAWIRRKLGVKLASIEELECKQCKNIFNPEETPNWSRQKFCSNECLVNFYRIKQNEQNAERIKQEKECPICKNKFIPNKTTKQKYCKRSCFTSFRKKITKALDRTLKCINSSKDNKASELLGYSAKDLLNHLESFPNFDELRKGSWHLDHIFPIIAFIDHGITNIEIINCLANLQPLSEKENNTKGDIYDEQIFDEWLKKQKIETN